MNKLFRALLSTACMAFILVGPAAALDVVVAVNGTGNATAAAPEVKVPTPPPRPIAGFEQCRYVNRSVLNETYDVFAGVAQMIYGDLGLLFNDTSAKVVLLELCGQPFIQPDSLLRKFVIEASGANLTAPVFYGLVDNVGYNGANLLSVVKSAKLVKILQLLNVQSGYVPPPLEFSTVYNNETKRNETSIVESKVDVLATPEWLNFTQQTLNVTTDDYLWATLNIAFVSPEELQEQNAVDSTENVTANKISDAIVGPKTDAPKAEVKTPVADKNDPQTKKAAEALAKELNTTVVTPPGIPVSNHTEKPAARMLYEGDNYEPSNIVWDQIEDGRRLIEIINNYQSQQPVVQAQEVRPQQTWTPQISTLEGDYNYQNVAMQPRPAVVEPRRFEQVPVTSVPVEVIRTSVLPTVVSVNPNKKPKSLGKKKPRTRRNHPTAPYQQQQTGQAPFPSNQNPPAPQQTPAFQQIFVNPHAPHQQQFQTQNSGNWPVNPSPQQYPQFPSKPTQPGQQFPAQDNDNSIFNSSYYFKTNTQSLSTKNAFVGASLQGRQTH